MEGNGTSINAHIQSLGRKIFNMIGEEAPSAFNKSYLTGRMLEWSLTKPSFKLNLFRLVDVLPTLRTPESIAAHVREYLAEPASEISSILRWGVNVAPNSLRGLLTSFAVRRAVASMAKTFIAGETPKQSLAALKRLNRASLAFTVDLLGEYSLSEREADNYLARYMEALEVLGTQVPKFWRVPAGLSGHPTLTVPVNVSVKLSALYAQCNVLNFERSVSVLSKKLGELASKALKFGAHLYVDAEDSSHNPIIYKTFMDVFGSSEFKQFPYPGIVLQAYAKDAPERLAELIEFAKKRNAPIAVRLVKGAYWDQETTVAQQNNWPSPLYKIKESSDARYEQLSRMLLDNHEHCFPAFGSHNVRSLAHACCYAETHGLTPHNFELQMLYGMAEPIGRAFIREGYGVRLYVPLGYTLPGMGYLVRRLLENTSNESFLRHTFFDDQQIEELLREPRLNE